MQQFVGPSLLSVSSSEFTRHSANKKSSVGGTEKNGIPPALEQAWQNQMNKAFLLGAGVDVTNAIESGAEVPTSETLF